MCDPFGYDKDQGCTMNNIETSLALHANDRLLDTQQLAELTGSTPQFWEMLRTKGGGPAFLKISRLVRYRQSAIDRWFAERTVTSTTQARGLKNKQLNCEREAR